MRSSSRVAWIIAGAVTASVASACFSFSDLSGGEDGGSDGSAGDASTTIDGSPTDGSATDDGATDDGGPLGGCKGSAGPPMVRTLTDANHYCIDSTEVTGRQYAQFVSSISDGGLPFAQPASCSWNTDFTNGFLIALNDKPKTAVDWCDAWSYCHWANKRLCGEVGGGGTTPPNDFADPSKSEWTNACVRDQHDGGVQPYTYGYTFDPTACNGGELDAGVLMIVASLPKCVGAYPGVYDLLGNADEWVDSCESDTGKTDCCPTQGGGFHDTDLGCGAGYVPNGDCTGRTRVDSHSDVGFRCCSD